MISTFRQKKKKKKIEGRNHKTYIEIVKKTVLSNY